MELGNNKKSEEPHTTAGSQESVFKRGRKLPQEETQQGTEQGQEPTPKKRKRWQDAGQTKRKKQEEEKPAVNSTESPPQTQHTNKGPCAPLKI